MQVVHCGRCLSQTRFNRSHVWQSDLAYPRLFVRFLRLLDIRVDDTFGSGCNIYNLAYQCADVSQ